MTRKQVSKKYIYSIPRCKRHVAAYSAFLQVHLVVATPGRILDLMEKQVANMEKCRILCLDEADKLLSQDFKGLLDRLISFLPPSRQVLLYSATFPLTVEYFMKKHMRDPYEVRTRIPR